MKTSVVLGLLATVAALAQRTPADVPLPTFNGIVKGIDKKILTLEEEGSNTLQFRCSKKTRYWEGQKSINPSAIKPGDAVSVEARRAPDGSLDAVTVRVHREKPEAPK